MEVYSFLCVKDKIKTLEIELDEERSSVELLNERISRSRDQVPYDCPLHANKRKHFGIIIVINVVIRAVFLAEHRFFSAFHSSQVDQLRSELMQERSERHDLEMDKSAFERQVPFIDVHKLMQFLPIKRSFSYNLW